MLEKLVSRWLTSYLGEYFADIDTEQLKISVWRGNAHLRNLRVRQDALRFWDVPFCVCEGTIADLQVVIPWARLMSQSVMIKIQGIKLILELKARAEGYTAERLYKEAIERKQRELQYFEEALLANWRERHSGAHTETGESESGGVASSKMEDDNLSKTFFARLKASILNNIKVEVEGLEVQYYTQDVPLLNKAEEPKEGMANSSTGRHTSSPLLSGHGICFHIRHLRTYACSETYVPAFTPAKQKILRKALDTQGVHVTLVRQAASNSAAAPQATAKMEQEMIVFPFDAFVKLQHQPVLYVVDIPTYLVGVRVNEVRMVLDNAQLQRLVVLGKELYESAALEMYWPLRPIRGNAKVDPAGWWRYAIEVVQLEQRKRRPVTKHFSWKHYQTMKQRRSEYIGLYMRDRRDVLNAAGWLDALSTEDYQRFQTLEEKLPVESIKLARQTALEKVEMERVEYSKLWHAQQQREVPFVQRTAQAERGHVAAPAWWGWLGRWALGERRSDAVKELMFPESPEARHEAQEMVEIMTTRRWTAAQRLTLAKEFGMSAEEAQELMQVPTLPQSATRATTAIPFQRMEASRHFLAKCFFQLISSEVRLCEKMDVVASRVVSPSAFAVLRMDGFTAGAGWYGADAGAELWMAVDDFGIETQRGEGSAQSNKRCDEDAEDTLKKDASRCVLMQPSSRASGHASYPQQRRKVDGDNVLAQVLQGASVALQDLGDRFQNQSAWFLSVQRNVSLSAGRGDATEWRVLLELAPVDVLVEVPLLERIVRFFFSATPPPLVDFPVLSEVVGGGSFSDLGTAAPPAADSAPPVPTPLEAVPADAELGSHRRHLPRLQRVLESERLVRWRVIVHELMFHLSAVPGEQESRVHLMHVCVHNDVGHTLHRPNPSLQHTPRTLADPPPSLLPNVFAVHEPQDAPPPSAFGKEEDLLDFAHVQIQRASVSILYRSLSPHRNPPTSGMDNHITSSGWHERAASGAAATATWHSFLQARTLSATVKKNVLLSSLQPTLPWIIVECETEHPLGLSCSRSGLSVLCISWSCVADFILSAQQQLLARQSLRRGMVGSASNDASSRVACCSGARLFNLRVLSMDTAYLTEPEAVSSDLDCYYQRFVQFTTLHDGHDSSLNPSCRRSVVEVREGMLVCYYADRPTQSQRHYELVRDHFHLIYKQDGAGTTGSDHEGRPCVLELFVEQGGAPHPVAREGYLAAKRYLQETLGLFAAQAFQNVELLKLWAEGWIQVRRAAAQRANEVDATEQAVREALVVIERASHSVPCHHLVLECDTAAQRWALATCIQESASVTPACTPLEDPLARVLQAEAEARGSRTAAFFPLQKLWRVTLTAPQCVMELLEEEGVLGEAVAAAQPPVPEPQPAAVPLLSGHRHVITLEPLQVSLEQRHPHSQVFSCTTSQLSALGAAAELRNDAAGVGGVIPVIETARATATSACCLCVEIFQRPPPLPFFTRTAVHVRGAVLSIHVSTALLNMVEMLWDGVGILSNRAYGYDAASCTPWREMPSAMMGGCGEEGAGLSLQGVLDKTEVSWRSHPCLGALRRNHATLRFDHIRLCMSYPCDGWEVQEQFALASARKGGPPVVALEGDDCELTWAHSNALHDARVFLKNPIAHVQCPLGSAPHSSASTPGAPTGAMTLILCPTPRGSEDFEALPSTGPAALSLHFTAVCASPVLSRSDWVRRLTDPDCSSSLQASHAQAERSACKGDDEAAAGSGFGYRYAQRACLSLTGVRILYWHPQLMGLLEMFVRGVVPRAVALGSRAAYVYGRPLLRWPHLEAPQAPASWELLKKHAQLKSITVYFPLHEAASVLLHGLRATPDINSVSDGPTGHLVVRIEQLTWTESLKKGRLPAPRNGVTGRETDATDEGSCVQQCAELVFHRAAVMRPDTVGSFAMDKCPFFFAGPLEDLSCCVSSPLFLDPLVLQAERLPSSNRRCPPLAQFDISALSPLVMRGGVDDYATLCECVCANFVTAIWRPVFAPVRVASDPFLVTAPVGTARGWLFHAETLCLHIIEPYDAMWEKGEEWWKPLYMKNAMVLDGVSVQLTLDGAGGFCSSLAVRAATVWNLGHLTAAELPPGAPAGDPMFAFLYQRSPAAASIDPVCALLCLAATFGSQQIAGSEEERASVQQTHMALGVERLDISVIPRFLFELRDTLFSRRLWDALGKPLQGPPYREKEAAPQAAAAEAGRVSCTAQIALLRLSLPRVHPQGGEATPFALAELENMAVDILLRDDIGEGRQLVGLQVSIDRVARNGIYVWQANQQPLLRPFLLNPLPMQHAVGAGDVSPLRFQKDIGMEKLFETMDHPTAAAQTTPWLTVTLSPERVLEAVLQPMWLLLPHGADLQVLHCLWSEGALAHLTWLTLFKEERSHGAHSVLVGTQGTALPSTSSSFQGIACCSWGGWGVQVVCHAPAVVLSERAANPTATSELTQGILFSCHRICLQRAPGSSLSFFPTEFYQVEQLSCCALSYHDVQLLQGFTVSLAHSYSGPTAQHAFPISSWKLHVSAVQACLAKRSYELLLHDLVKRTLGSWGGGATPLDVSSLSAPLAAPAAAAVRRQKFFFGLDGLSAPECAAAVAPVAEATLEALQIEVVLESLDLRVMDGDKAVYLTLADGLKVSHASTFAGAAAPHPCCSEQEMCMAIRLHSVRLGVDGLPPLVDRQCGKESDTDVVDAHTASIVREGSDEVVEINLGHMTLYLESRAMVTALTVLYKPYAEMVLPGYRIQEERVLERDTTLTDHLTLCRATRLRVSNALRNHITINGANLDVHFYDDGGCGAVLILEDGLTLRFIHCNIFLHGKSLDSYTRMGNGSYIIIDRTCNRLILGDTVEENLGAAVEQAPLSLLEELFGKSQDDGGLSPEHVAGAASAGKTTSPGGAALRRCRKIMARGALCVMLPGAPPVDVPGAPTVTAVRQPRRYTQSIVLRARLALCATASLISLDNAASGCHAKAPPWEQTVVFDVEDFNVCSERAATDASPATSLEQVTLISKWSVKGLYSGGSGHAVGGASENPQMGSEGAKDRAGSAFHIELLAGMRVDVHLRYSDVFLCTEALREAQNSLQVAFGNFEASVFTAAFVWRRGGHYTSAAEDDRLAATVEEATGPAAAITTFLISIASVNLYVVDDFTSAAGSPLLHVLIEDLVAHGSEQQRLKYTWDLHGFLEINHYDGASTAWEPFLDKVEASLTGSEVRNASLEDFLHRKEKHHLEVHVGDTKLYIGPTLLANLRRLWQLHHRIATWQSVFFALTAPDSCIPHATSPLNATREPADDNFGFRFEQRLGRLNVEICFAQDSEGRHAPPPHHHLQYGESFSFNFPRTDGRELSSSQLSVLVSCVGHEPALVNVAAKGCRPLCLGGPAFLQAHAMVDVQLKRGLRVVYLRTNIRLSNELPFMMALSGGVGVLQPCEVCSVPLECLQKRAVFLPLPGLEPARQCVGCTLGGRYASLVAYTGLSFLCVSPLEAGSDRNALRGVSAGAVLSRGDNFVIQQSFQRCVYFFLHFPVVQRATTTCMVTDVCATFVAPLHITNRMGIPIHVTFLTQRVAEGARIGPLELVPEARTFDVVASANINAGERYGVTAMDPFEDLCIDLTFSQSNGGVWGRPSQGRFQNSPALVFSPHRRSKCADRLILQDAKGTTLVVRFAYLRGEVQLWCPYWVLNETPHLLLLCDASQQSTLDTPNARLDAHTGNAIRSALEGTPFLYNSHRADQKGEKAAVFVRIGLSLSEAGQRTLWSGWSGRTVSMAMLTECGTVECAMPHSLLVATLSYSVEVGLVHDFGETRVIVFRPRWVLVNRTPHVLAIKEVNGLSKSQASLPDGNGAPSAVVERDARHMITFITRSSSQRRSTHLQLRYAPSHGGGDGAIVLGEWSCSFCIDTFGDYDLNLFYEGLVHLEDHWPKSEGCVQPSVLPPLSPEDIVERRGEFFVKRAAADVIHVSCFRSSSVMRVVVSVAEHPPYVVENRTEFMVCVQQRHGTRVTKMYPKTTKPYMWEDPQGGPHEMSLWAFSADDGAQSATVHLNFDPRVVTRDRGGDLHQKQIDFAARRHRTGRDSHAPCDDCILFIRVRSLHGVTYAISITEEPTIDANLILPYPQHFYKLEICSIFALFSDAEDMDLMLLSIQPLKVGLVQCVAKGKEGGALEREVQRFDLHVRAVQLDDERANAKEKVVAMLLDYQSSFFRFERQLLRTTPVLYCPLVKASLAPVELHLEDSFVYDAQMYLDYLQTTWQASFQNTRQCITAVSRCSNCDEQHALQPESGRWAMEEETRELPITPRQSSRPQGGREAAPRDWLVHHAAIDHLVIEKLLVSISLYRNPGAHKDPMWQRFGALSLLIGSIKDAKLDWPRLAHENLCGPLWVLGTRYYDYYKMRLDEQTINLVSVVGFTEVRSFMTDLLHNFFSGEQGSDAGLSTTPPRSKERVGKRRAAAFRKDALKREREGEAAGPAKGPMFPRAVGPSRMVETVGMRVSDVATRCQWQFFTQMATAEETQSFGFLALQAMLRRAADMPIYRCERDAMSAAEMLYRWRRQTQRATTISHATTSPSLPLAPGGANCTRCDFVERLQMERIISAQATTLPHPREGTLTWTEYVHHVPWDEFVLSCSDEEILRFRNAVAAAAAGTPKNVIRLVRE